MKKKQPVYKGLDKTSVLYNDRSEYSPDIFDITDYPKRLTAGKNILQFRGNLANIAQNSPLDIEIIDYNGEPIYHEITSYIAEDKSRVVAIYIYPDTSPGPATITLLTEIQSINGTMVPAEWKNVYNAKWSRTVYVNPTLVNESEIIFETLPTVNIEEQVGVQLDRTYQVGQYVTYNSGSVKYVSLNNSPALILTDGAFSSSMKGGTVTINNPINPLPNPIYSFTSVPYTTTIKKVLNTSSVLLDTEYSIIATHSIFPHTYTSFENSSYSLSYDQSPSYTETQNSESYAIIKINNLDPLTGDISRIKTYINNAGTVGTWEQISDIELEETEIFVVSTASIAPDKSIGFIESQTTINNYFTSASIYDGKNLLGTSTIAYNTTKLNNSMYVISSGSIPNVEYDLDLAELVDFWGFTPPPWWGFDWPPYVPPQYIDSTNTSVSVLRIKDAYKGTFLKNSNYKVTLDAVGVGSTAKLSVYASGSAFNINTTDRFNRELPITVGKKIGELDVSKLGNRIDDHVLSFTADNDGTGVLIFILEKGNWYISDIRTTSDNDAGYTPNYTRIRALVPTSHKSDVQLNFKIEYYNAAGFKCKQDNYVNNVPWAGGNRYIDGDYSMLTGSLYVADSLNSGIAISGYKNSGFVRSLGYNGFAAGSPGFLLWSGSAMSGSSGTKGGVPYSGVGLELYANPNNYFRYSTANSELDIRTNSFFLGSTSSSFLSGSSGKLQISASNFSVSATGNVSASNIDISGVSQANIIRNKTVVITTSNSSSYIQTVAAAGSITFGGNTFKPSYQILVLDGSLGGEKVQRVRLNYNSPITSFTYTLNEGLSYNTFYYPVAIGGIKLPSVTNDNNATCIVEISTGRLIYMNNDVGAFGSWWQDTFTGGNFVFNPDAPGGGGGGGVTE